MTEKEPEVNGITKSDFQSWKHHPVSKVFFEFLKDKRLFVQQFALDQWVEGGIQFTPEQALRGQIIELFEIAALEFEKLHHFYQEKTEQDNGSQDS